MRFPPQKKPAALLNASPEVQAHAAWIDLQLKLRQCEKFPTRGRLEEDEVRSQLERKGVCLNEGAVIFRAILETSSARFSELASQALTRGYTAYENNCANPPSPPALPAGKKRTAEQTLQYRAELSDRLAQDCVNREKPAYGLLLDLRQTLPREVSVFSDQVMKTMKVKSP